MNGCSYIPGTLLDLLSSGVELLSTQELAQKFVAELHTRKLEHDQKKSALKAEDRPGYLKLEQERYWTVRTPTSEMVLSHPLKGIQIVQSDKELLERFKDAKLYEHTSHGDMSEIEGQKSTPAITIDERLFDAYRPVAKLSWRGFLARLLDDEDTRYLQYGSPAKVMKSKMLQGLIPDKSVLRDFAHSPFIFGNGYNENTFQFFFLRTKQLTMSPLQCSFRSDLYEFYHATDMTVQTNILTK